jgi:hypothetical protein
MPFGSELRNPKPHAERILMVIALPNKWERENSGRVQRSGSFAEAKAAGWRLIKDERKWFAEFANSAKSRQRRLDVGRTRPCCSIPLPRRWTYGSGAARRRPQFETVP